MDWHKEYKERYAKLKAAGKSFFPYAVAHDTIAASLIFVLLCALAWHFGAALEDLADPTDSTYNPRPEWYFLFLFQALKLFPGHLEAVAAVLLPGLGLLVLVFVPFLDRGPERHPFQRPFWTVLGLVALSGISYLTWEGFRSPMTNPVVEKDPLVSQGQRLYMDLKCAYCHSVRGKGGRLGPDLARTAGAVTDEWLTRHFRDPQSVTPGSAMPKLNLMDDEIKALVAYVKTMGGGDSFSPEAPVLFTESCAACHKVGKNGSDVGPDLSLIGSARDVSYIKKYIEDPAALNTSAAMPGFKEQLTAVQIEDLARYLSSQRGGP